MRFPTTRQFPLRRLGLITCVLSCALSAGASSAPSTLGTLLKDSPFIPPGFNFNTTQPPVLRMSSAPPSLELHGYSIIGNNLMFSLYDIRSRSSFWVTPNDPRHPEIQIVNFDLPNNTLDLTANGRDMQLTLQPPSTQAMPELLATPPLVVYSPFYTGDHNGAAVSGGIPAPVPAPVDTAQAPFRGQLNNRGNFAAQAGGGFGRGAFTNNPAAGGIAASATNNATVNSGAGYGAAAGGTPIRRPIQQPAGAG